MPDRLPKAASWALKPVEYVGQVFQLAMEAAGYIARGAIGYRQTVDQMAQTGFNSLPLVVLTLGFTGMVMAFHLGQQSSRFQAANLVGWLVAETVCRELGPVMASIVAAARVGSAIAAEIGTMKVTEQIDALRAMATSPTQYLVVPRLLACLLMVPALVIIGDLAGIGGGYLFAWRSANLSAPLYLTSIQTYLRPATAAAGVGKAFFFGIIIAIVGCHQGLFCRQAAEDVGKATTRSVVYSIVGIFVSDYFLSKVLFPE